MTHTNSFEDISPIRYNFLKRSFFKWQYLAIALPMRVKIHGGLITQKKPKMWGNAPTVGAHVYHITSACIVDFIPSVQ